MPEVNDPNLLAQLNAGLNNETPIKREVTDPQLLSELNRKEVNPGRAFLQQNAKRTAYDDMQDFGAGGMYGAQFIGALLGEGGNAIASLLTGGYAPQVNVREEMGLGKKNPVNIGQLLSSKNPNPIAQTMGQFFPGVAGGGASLPGQIISNALYGATQANPDDKNFFGLLPQGRPGAAIEGAVGGALPFVAKPILNKLSKITNIVRPNKTASNIAEQTITDTQKEYAKGIKQQKLAYDKFYIPHGEKEVTSNPHEYLGLTEKQIGTLYPTAGKLRINFLEKPSANNLHEFQSQVGKDAVKSRDEYLKQTFRDIQNSAHDKLEAFSKSLNDPIAHNGLLEGKRITRDIVKPFETTLDMKRIAKKNIKPKEKSFDEVSAIVKKATESGENILDPITGEVRYKIRGIPEGHYLNTVKNKLLEDTKMINRRRIARNALLTGLGGLGFGGIEEFIRRH